MSRPDVSPGKTRFCPKCGTDWRGSEIPRSSVERGVYGHRAPCGRKQVWDLGMDEVNAPCTCPPRYFSHLIAVELPHYDGASLWMCPACGTQWNRWTGAEVAPLESSC